MAGKRVLKIQCLTILNNVLNGDHAMCVLRAPSSNLAIDPAGFGLGERSRAILASSPSGPSPPWRKGAVSSLPALTLMGLRRQNGARRCKPRGQGDLGRIQGGREGAKYKS